MNEPPTYLYDSPDSLDLSAVGCSVLIAMVTDLRARVARLQRDEHGYLSNLTATQKRCTELLEENRGLRGRVQKLLANIDVPDIQGARAHLASLKGITLAGWTCPDCHIFNGEEKETLAACRVCDGPRP